MFNKHWIHMTARLGLAKKRKVDISFQEYPWKITRLRNNSILIKDFIYLNDQTS